MFAERARAYGAYFAFCNLVGGQDELVFDGQSFVVDPDGEVIARAAQFEEELLVCEVPGRRRPAALAEPLADLAEVYAALVLGLRDYVAQERLPPRRPRALGRDRLGPGGAARRRRGRARSDVSCVVMPSPHSSDETQEDARTIAANLGGELIEIPIEPMMAAYEEALARSSTPARRRDPSRCRATRRDPPSPTSPPRTSRRGSAAT